MDSKNKKSWLPIILLTLMLVTIALSFILRHWLCYYFAAQMILFHLAPPFAIVITIPSFDRKSRFYFSQFKWEEKFFEKIKIKKWKDKLPTYQNKHFSFTHRTPQQILWTTIHSENVHIFLFFASFIPITLGIFVGHFAVLIPLSIFMALLHIPFALVQRYNRPRLLKSRLFKDFNNSDAS